MTSTEESEGVRHGWVDDVPVAWIEPPAGAGGATVALWLPHLGGSTQACLPAMRELAELGMIAVSLDPWRHGRRGGESAAQLTERVLGDFRQEMWPLLGRTTVECVRVLDWAAAELGAGPGAVAGGVSMGGDCAVALAGLDHRVRRVAAVAATADWTRPGMCALDDPARLLPQGHAGRHAQWWFDRLNPLTNIGAYAHGPAIAFECGADDSHVPPQGALRFRETIEHVYPRHAGRIRVTVHPGTGHLDAARDPELTRRCLAWLAQPGGQP
ncbi:prolyl oligopeptidase family serine peptidase [Nonomuraea sp. NPDC048881]|uniref:prolyl oligopeptidase family serine peptidase n=1 Tax=Nonomuraea sp. NPDC048881 TaxID=3155030 RepID=UPI0033D2CAF1